MIALLILTAAPLASATYARNDSSLSCVASYACNVRGANLLGYYNVTEEATRTSNVEEVSHSALK